MLGAPPPLISSASVFHRYPSCCSPVFLIPAAHYQRDRVIRQRPVAAPLLHPTARASRHTRCARKSALNARWLALEETANTPNASTAPR